MNTMDRFEDLLSAYSADLSRYCLIDGLPSTQVHQTRAALTSYVANLVKELETEKQTNEDHAEDWAMCGIPHESLLTKALVLSDQNRKLAARVAELEKGENPLDKLTNQ